MKKTIFTLLSIAMLLVFSFCTKDQATDPALEECNTPEVVSYQTDIFPIFEASCAFSNCHASSAAIGDFTTYASTLSYLENGNIENRAITLGNMPPANFNPLSNCEVELLQRWIDADYLNN